MKKIAKEKIMTWFVTGASSGVGSELCKQLLERGYNVIAVSRRIPDFKHENALCLSADVTNPDSINGAIKKGIEQFGRIDVLSNNAGICSHITLEEEELSHMKEVMETNFFGIFNTMNALLPHFRHNKNGTIINNTSMSGLSIRLRGSAYCSSKHAVEGLTGVCWHEAKSFCRTMAYELGYYPETNIIKNSKVVETEIEEYKKVKDFYKCIDYTFENDLNAAIKIIIDQVEQEKLPRRLMLGKDANIKIDAEIKYLKKDLKTSKRLTSQCSKYKITLKLILMISLLTKAIKKLFKKIHLMQKILWNL